VRAGPRSTRASGGGRPIAAPAPRARPQIDEMEAELELISDGAGRGAARARRRSARLWPLWRRSWPRTASTVRGAAARSPPPAARPLPPTPPAPCAVDKLGRAARGCWTMGSADPDDVDGLKEEVEFYFEQVRRARARGGAVVVLGGCGPAATSRQAAPACACLPARVP